MTVDGVGDSVRIDGFTIAGGRADGGSNGRGAGMFISNASPAVVRVTFTENSALGHGGGAMHIEGTAHPLIVNCSMTANIGSVGGAMHIDPAPASATLVNCLISGNTASSGGAIDARSNFPATLDLINCTVTDNTAQNSGGGIWVFGTMEVTITNSILWGNVPDQIDGVATVTYSDVEGGWAGEGNLNPPLDPLFVDPGTGDYRLMQTSPCIDVANNDDVPCDQFDLDNDGFACVPPDDEGTPDLDLINRVLDGDANGEAIVDMGSYEFRHPFVCSCPDICPADLDGNCEVGVKDLLILLGAWGPCGDCADCPADVVIDCAVDVKDLLFLLGAWGPCPCEEGPPPPSLADALAAACVTQENWGDFLDVIETGSEAEKENWLCWMNHHLNVCTNCICPHFPGICPGPDPF